MKTSPAARRVWKLRIGLACLAIAALASFNLWAGSYCYRNRGKISMPKTSPQPATSGNMTVSEMWLAAR